MRAKIMQAKTKRAKTTATCAVGAMLFGGTLGEAHAGVVGLTGPGYSSAYFNAGNWSTYDFASASGAPISGAVSLNSLTLGSVNCSQFTSNGFSLSANYAPGTNYTLTVVQYFVVDSDVSYSLVGETLNDDLVQIELYNADGWAGTITPDDVGAFNLTGTLAAATNGQYYRFEYYTNRSAQGQNSDTLFDLSFTSVPAPGAIALLGLAGLAGRRRR